jgi:YesN/AraC family two-component response regulator
MSRAKKTLRHIAKTERPLILGYRDIGHDEHAGAAEGKEAVSAIGLKTSRYRDIIEKSREYIRLHYAEGSISLNSVAEFVGLSPNHFSTVFSQETGETFIEYLTRTRLAKAGEMLKSTRAKSSEIAYSVGYSDPHYFSYVFKKNIGVSPSEFRK